MSVPIKFKTRNKKFSTYSMVSTEFGSHDRIQELINTLSEGQGVKPDSCVLDACGEVQITDKGSSITSVSILIVFRDYSGDEIAYSRYNYLSEETLDAIDELFKMNFLWEALQGT